ncbi:MAG: energy-coupling factor transporter ATPase [Clostridia bacterium]|nr:energy-coupling factor transporter ATPase [Clostridia bacterium]
MRVKLANVTHVYLPHTPQETKALDDIHLDVESGKIVGIIGKTGSGKSTLIQTMNRLITPTRGSVWLDELDISQKKVNLSLVRQQVGIIFQYPEYQLFEDTVYNDVAFGPRNLNLAENEVDLRVKEALQLMGLDVDQIGGNSPLALSGGQKRRVAIAGILAMRPRVLVLDEPTAALDPKGRTSLLELLINLRRDRQMTVVIVSHGMDELAQIADSLVVLNHGRVVLQGSPREVFGNRDQLVEMGLAVPQLTELMIRLKERGMKVAADILTLEEAVNEICRNGGKTGD